MAGWTTSSAEEGGRTARGKFCAARMPRADSKWPRGGSEKQRPQYKHREIRM